LIKESGEIKPIPLPICKAKKKNQEGTKGVTLQLDHRRYCFLVPWPADSTLKIKKRGREDQFGS